MFFSIQALVWKGDSNAFQNKCELQEGEMVTLTQLAPQVSWSIISPGLKGMEGGRMLIWKSFSFKTLPTSWFPSIECVGLEWNSKESLAIWLVYQPPNAPAETMLNLLEVVSGWALGYSRLQCPCWRCYLYTGLGPSFIHCCTRTLLVSISGNTSSRSQIRLIFVVGNKFLSGSY